MHLVKSSFGIIAWALALAACSGGGGGSAPMPPAPTASLELLAGHVGGASNVDGIGPVARFTNPQGLAVDAGGNIFVGSSCTIRKVTQAGVVTTFANAGCPFASIDPAATLFGPSTLAIDGPGNIYAVDSLNIIRKVSPTGVISTLTGIPSSPGCSDSDGPLATATFCVVNGLATNATGDLYTSTTTDIRKISSAGIVSTVAGSFLSFGNVDGVGSAARFSGVDAIATDAAGNIYAADSVSKTIRMITPAGVVTTLAGTAGVQGSTDAQGAAASFMFPNGVTTDLAGNVYVADFGQAIRKIAPGGQVSTLAGTAGVTGSSDGAGAAARFGGGKLSIGTDRDGNIYVADFYNDDIRKVTPAGAVTTIAGSPPVNGSSDGAGTAATFSKPMGIAIDGGGNLIVADGGRSVRKVSPSGVVSTLAGAGAGFSHLVGIALDSSGNTFATDSSCDFLGPPGPGLPGPPCSGTIQQVSPTGVVTIFAGTAGISGSVDGTGAAASFMRPIGIAIDSSGNLFVVDVGAYVVRKISPAGVVTTIAGSPGMSGSTDGVGSAARFHYPGWIAVDRGGNAYVTDMLDGSIRKISPAGEVTTLVPAGIFQNGLEGIAVDDQNNLYVADYWDSTISKVTAAGIVSTIAGVTGQASFEPGPLPGKVFFPIGLAIGGSDLYMTLGDGIAVVHHRP